MLFVRRIIHIEVVRGQKVEEIQLSASIVRELDAFYKSCPKHPPQVDKKVEEDRIRKVQEAEVKAGLSYAEIVRASSAERVEKKVVKSAERKLEGSLEGKIEEILKRLLPQIIRSLKIRSTEIGTI